MKKFFLFAALLLGTAAFAQDMVTAKVDHDLNEEATDDLLSVANNWESGKSYPEFNLDEYIKVGTLSEGTENGVYYATDRAAGDWRIYQARAIEKNEAGDTISYGKFWLKAEKGAKITKAVFLYSTNYNKGGGLISRTSGVNLTDSIKSGEEIDLGAGDSILVLYAGTSAGAIKAQVRIQQFVVFYETGTGLNDQQAEKKAIKVIRDGQMFVVTDEKEYNVLGF